MNGHDQNFHSLESHTQPNDEHLLYVCFGSQSGVAESFCDKLQKTLWKEYNIFARKVDLDYFDVLIQLKEKVVLLIIYATYGEGGPCDNARDFHDWVCKPTNDNNLGNISFAVFGLGDSIHPIFCAASVKLDGRLKERGAIRLAKLVKRDEQQHKRNSEEEYEAWKAQIIPILKTFKWKEHPEQQEEMDRLNGVVPKEQVEKRKIDWVYVISFLMCALVILYKWFYP